MKNLVAGIDVGERSTFCALVDEFGKIYATEKFSTNDYKSFNSFMDKVKTSVESLSRNLDEPHTLCAAGIGIPNGNYYTGEIENAPNLIWKGKLPFSQKLSSLLGMPVVVANDANAAAIGEMMYGGARGMKDFVLITIGTGLGSGIVVNGNVVNGYDGFAGEFGHICAQVNGRQCACGKKGCLECYASTSGIKKTFLELSKNNKVENALKDKKPEDITLSDISKAAKKGDSIAKQTFTETGNILGIALANLISIVSPEAIFINGSVARLGDQLLAPTKKALEANLMRLWKGKVKLLLSSIDSENAPLLGAAALAIKEMQKRSVVIERRRLV
ncbi:MAG: ROK family protein [Bacteroidales bacterium]|jgi:glucokinase|nr:ROK family protein [Bacteroidales bacterium]